MSVTVTVVRRVALAMMLASLFAGPAALAADITLRVGAGHPTALPQVNQVAKTFVPRLKERIAAETTHNLRIIEGYAGTIANAAEILESVEKGLLDVGALCACFEPTKLPYYNISLFLPFMTGDPNVAGPSARQIYTEVPFFNATFGKYNQTYLSVGSADEYGLISTFEWTRVDDLKGRKIGGSGPNLPWLDYAGATKVQTNLNEAFNALQSGVYQGLIMTPAPFYTFRLFEVGRYYTFTGWGASTNYPISMNLRSLANLPEDARKILLEVAVEYGKAVDRESVEKAVSAIEEVKKAGVKVQSLADEERVKMAMAIEPWVNERAQEWQTFGVPGKQTFERYMALIRENGGKPLYLYKLK